MPNWPDFFYCHPNRNGFHFHSDIFLSVPKIKVITKFSELVLIKHVYKLLNPPSHRINKTWVKGCISPLIKVKSDKFQGLIEIKYITKFKYYFIQDDKLLVRWPLPIHPDLVGYRLYFILESETSIFIFISNIIFIQILLNWTILQKWKFSGEILQFHACELI